MIIKYLNYIKLLITKPDPFLYLFIFERRVNKNTWLNRKEILKTAEKQLADKNNYEKEELYLNSNDPLVRQGYELKQKIKKEFKDILLGKSNARILIHVPSPSISPAGFSLFTNFAESFEFIGIPTRILGWDDSTKQALDEFKPNVFITSDHPVYLDKVDWGILKKYRELNTLKIGLSTPSKGSDLSIVERLNWAKEHKIDFYYNYRDINYTNTKKEYRPFLEAGYNILSIPFGANILHYYPIPNIEKDVNYVFLASTNKTKVKRCIRYLLPIVSKYSGFIDGPGWKNTNDFNFNRDRDRYIYARSKIGLNIHLDEQIDIACEVNERTYQLAACGVPQITDDAKILPKLFSDNALFIAKNPKEYKKHYNHIIKNPNIGVERALVAQREVFEKHTTFHRVKSFIEQLGANNMVK